MDRIKELSSRTGKTPTDILNRINGADQVTDNEREELLKPRSRDRGEIKSNILNRQNKAEIYAKKTGRKIENEPSEDNDNKESDELELLDFDGLEDENESDSNGENSISDEKESANSDQTDEKETTEKEKNDEKSDKNEGKSSITFLQSAVLICIAGGILATVGISAIKSVSNWDFKKTSADFAENAGILMGMNIEPTENKAEDYINYVSEMAKEIKLIEEFVEISYKYDKKENKMSFIIDGTFVTVTPDTDTYKPKKKGKARVLYTTNETGDFISCELIEIIK